MIISRIRAGLGTILLPVTGVGAKSNADEWEELQSRGYHPELEVIIERYQRDIDVNDADGWVAFMGARLGCAIDLHDKRVLEIGHGGGWYLAQSLRAGATSAYGIEISATANEKARQALAHFGYESFALYEPVAKGLAGLSVPPIDVVFSLTVFQHLAPAVLKDYLDSLPGILATSGVVYMQTLENDLKTRLRRSPQDVLSVSYHPDEIRELIAGAGLEVELRVPYRYAEGPNYGGMYKLVLPQP